MVKNKNNKNAQAFSADILVVIVIVLFGGLFLVMNKIDEERSEDISVRAEAAAEESRIIVNELENTNVISQEDNSINKEELLTLDKEELKQRLDIENDFAIVFEKDGKLVQIDSQNDINCVGSSSISVNDQPCQ